MYYVCAKEFGWDKKQVDSQPIEYLKKLLATHIAVSYTHLTLPTSDLV